MVPYASFRLLCKLGSSAWKAWASSQDLLRNHADLITHLATRNVFMDVTIVSCKFRTKRFQRQPLRLSQPLHQPLRLHPCALQLFHMSPLPPPLDLSLERLHVLTSSHPHTLVPSHHQIHILPSRCKVPGRCKFPSRCNRAKNIAAA